MVLRAGLALLAAAVLAGGCKSNEVAADEAARPAAPADSASAATDAGAPLPTDADRAGWQACAERIAAVKKDEALGGAASYEEQRVQFARVRGRPMLWRRVPGEMPAELASLRKKNEDQVRLVRELKHVLHKKKARDRRRELVLRESYLWSEDVGLALALLEQVSLIALFDEPSIVLDRGVDRYDLDRKPRTKLDHERYVYRDGPLAGETAEILFGDRVAVTAAELDKSPPLGIDLHDATARGDFDRIRPLHLTAGALVADLRYGPDTWVPAVFDLDGPHMKLACEALDDALATRKATFVHDTAGVKNAVKRLYTVVRQMVREEIPFDADDGQTNGFLRQEWKRAYLRGHRRFETDGKFYDVYNARGEPIPPQVCIDFITDVWERASGSWYQPMAGDPLKPQPKRTEGGIDFDKLGIDNRRSVAEFTEFAEQHADLFEVWEVPKAERIPFKKRKEFFEYLHDKADMFRPGDFIFIYGTKHGRPHYHSLFILEQDPVTGVPILVGGNAVFPREQTLEGIMQISPQRSIKHRIRAREPWLEIVGKLAD
jgi:hypothetical protein